MKKGMGWPIGITVALVVMAASNVWVAVIASDPNALAVEPDYYEKAVHFDATMRQAQHNLALGWTLEPAIEPVSTDSGAVVRAQLHDAVGQALSGAVVHVTALHNALANFPVQATLADDGNGAYSARLPIHRTGAWELRFVVQRGADRFTSNVRVDAPRAAP